MKKKLVGILPKTMSYRVLCSIVVMWICSHSVSVLYAQTDNRDFEAKVDSLKKAYLEIGIEDVVAEQRARLVLAEEMQTGITTRQGLLTVPPNPGSIHVNRDLVHRAFTPQQLVDSIFVKGGFCSAVSNVKLTAHGWDDTTLMRWTTDDIRGMGYFTRGTSNFEMESGLVLSTGGLVTCEGPNSVASGVASPAPQVRSYDPDLLSIEANIRNASILEFDFVPINNVVVFRYIFASEEYAYWVNSFNDVFGFFISGPGIPGGKQNIALIPGSGSIVSINNVNDGKREYNLHNCPVPLAGMNSSYYINIPGIGSSIGFGGLNCNDRPLLPEEDSLYRSIEFNGRTVVLTATCAVIPCESYHLKLAVANTGDFSYQSAVFLEARSFDIGEYLVNWGSMNEGQDHVYRGCLENKFVVYRSGDDNSQPETVTLSYGGTALSDISLFGGGSLPTTVVIPAGQDSVSVSYSVNQVNTGYGTFEIFCQCPCGSAGYTKIIHVYDPSDPNNFSAIATPACPGQNDGEISIVTGSGGSGSYESSIDGGATWQSSVVGYTGLAPGIYSIMIRDEGGCTSVTSSVSTFFKPTISGDANICPPTYSTTLTASGTGPAYQWFVNGDTIVGAIYQTYIATITGKYTVAQFNGKCYSEMSDTVYITSDNCLWAEDDNVQTFKETSVIIKVLDNDLLGLCPSLTPTIVPPVLNGIATISGNQIIFTPAAGFTGVTTFTYQIECYGNTDNAVVTVRVLDFPDNIIDPDCVDSPPSTPFTFNLQAQSPPSHTVSNLSIPLVGDIDNDGIIEIIVPGEYDNLLQGGYGVCASRLHIFKYINDSIVHWQTLTTPYFNTLANPYSIAQVDNDGYAAIFLCTDYLRNMNQGAGANDRQRLIKYQFNGTQFVEQYRVTYSTNANKEMAQPMITDFNGDGIPEILVYDKVFNARTLTLLADGGYLNNPAMSFGQGGHTNNSIQTESSSLMAVADVDGDGLPDVIAGDRVYKVNITNSLGTSGNSFTLWNTCNKIGPDGVIHDEVADGATSVADIDGDGQLDVVVTVTARTNPSSNSGALYVWNPRTGEVIHSNVINTLPPATNWYGPSAAFIGDIDNDGEPEICFTAFERMYAYGFNRTNNTLFQKWSQQTNDTSGATTMSMFDFNQDGKNELVYRDEQYLRVLRGDDGTDMITPVACTSATGNEYPVIADINNDGAAEIIVTGGLQLWVYSSNPAGMWASARKVWNQYSYNVVNIKNDLTVPPYQLNPATLFPGADGVLGTTDDVRPFNGYLKQQTTLDLNGTPKWLWPDIYTSPALVGTTVSGNTVTVHVGIVNQGEAAIGPPICVALYRETSTQLFNATTLLTVNCEPILIMQGDTAYVDVTIPDITDLLFSANIVIRLNDNGNDFPVQPECYTDNNTLTILNPALHLMMKKHATLHMIPTGSIVHDGFYANPVATLNGDTIEYRIEAINTSLTTQNLTIIDTIPAYLDYIANSSNYSVTELPVGVNPQRIQLSWSINAAPTAPTIVTFRARPQPGVNASQPLFINRAWVTISGVTAPTNYTWHQGAGVSFVTFSAGFGGNIYNATEQALDYYTSPHAGIVIVPDEGFLFTGWSHADYLSLRHETIPAQNGIMHYDTLTIYGDVELHADFELEIYPVIYHLNGGYFPDSLVPPGFYTIESDAITLIDPQKENDVFLGWTGSNGNEPQQTVTIPARSTGEREYYANFLYSERKRDLPQKEEPATDRIWAAGHELFVSSSKPGSILRIYSESGIVLKQQVLLLPGETRHQLPSGLYIVTLNNSVGHIVRIE